MSYLFFIGVILSSTLSFFAFAYSSTSLTLMNGMLGNSIHILGGNEGKDLNPEEKKLLENTVLIVTGKSNCSGTVIGQCVLTAAHCLDDRKFSQILLGEKPLGDRTTGKVKVNPSQYLGFSKTAILNKQEDLAIIRIYAQFPENLGLALNILPSQALKKRDLQQSALIMGYGDSKYVVSNDLKTKKQKEISSGSGTRRTGNATLLGYHTDKDRRLLLVGGSLQKTSHIPLHGDSGGPLFYNGKLYGVSSTVIAFHKKGAGTEDDTEEASAENILYAQYASTYHHRQWITDSLNTLQCDQTKNKKPTSKQDFETEIISFLKTHIDFNNSEAFEDITRLSKYQSNYLTSLIGSIIYSTFKDETLKERKIRISIGLGEENKKSALKNGEFEFELFDDKSEERLYSVIVRTQQPPSKDKRAVEVKKAD